MAWSLLILLVASLLASGILFKHQRVLTFLAAAGALWEGQWLLLTLLQRTLLQNQDAQRVLLAGSVVLLTIWALYYKQGTFPYFSSTDSGRRDAAVIVVLVIVLAAAWLVTSHNGFIENTWVTHGFYNGDTATFVSLVQRSAHEKGLVTQNPFAGNGPLEYPTLLHAGVANLLPTTGNETGILHLLTSLTFIQILFTIPLFFLLWDIIYPEPTEDWRKWFGVPSRFWILGSQAALILYILALSWDNYVYSQSHFFLTGLFVMQTSLLLSAHSKNSKQQLLPLVPAALIGLVLLRANAVMGTAAIALLAVYCLLRMNDKKRPLNERTLFLFSLLATVFTFLTGHTGAPAFGKPGLSYTATADMLRLTPALVILAIGIFRNLVRQAIVSTMSVALTLLALFTFFFSTRDIIVENASRFFYLALLVGFPLILGQLIQLWYWLKRELLYSSHTLVELATGWGIVITGVALLLMPAVAAVTSAHDNLMFKDEQKVDTPMRQAVWWIEDHTPANTVFLASPNEPFAIPLFTGRSLLRTNYWLSPDDIVLNDVKAAFSGIKAAQEQVLSQADYLVLTKDQRPAWEPLSLPKVFDINAVVIYKLK